MATIQKKIRQRWTQEAIAGAAITPGHLLQYSAVETVVVHAAAAGVVNGVLVALEDQASGGSTTKAYAANDRVILQSMLPGEQVEMIASAAVAVNALVESAGDGRVRTTTAANNIGRAITAAAAAGDRITVEII